MSIKYQTPPEEAEKPGNDAPRTVATTPIYTIVLIVGLVIVFICQVAVDGPDSLLYGGDTSAILAGFVKSAFLDGQYWRLLTSATLHGGLIHLGFNCYALWILGKLIEALSNRAHLAPIFLLSAIAGDVMSFFFLPNGLTIGASGGIVGFLGYLTVYAWLRRKLLSPGFLRSLVFNIGFMAFYGIFVNSVGNGPKIDNFAHLGGLLAGAVYGFIQIPKDLYKDPREVSKTTEIIGLASLGIFLAVSIFTILIIFRVI